MQGIFPVIRALIKRFVTRKTFMGVQDSKMNPHVIIRAKRFAALWAFPRPGSEALFNALLAE
jgi:hypothetical protein